MQIIDLSSMVFNEQKQAIHDLIVGTVLRKSPN